MDCSSKYSISCCDIVHWKKPAVTVAALVLLDVGFLIFRSFNMSIMSSMINKIFFFTIFMILKQQLFNKSAECEMLKREKIEQTYVTVFDEVNKCLDKLRKTVLLHEVGSLVRLLIFLFFVITFGSYFSTLSMLVIGINLYVLSNYGDVKHRVKEYSNHAIGIAGKILSDNIPRYRENK